jgi:chromosome segregation ATPase
MRGMEGEPRVMREQLQSRLNGLKTEFENGQRQLAEVENQAASLRQTLLRISGAIQVLEEELSKAEGDEPGTKESLTADTGSQG